MPAQTGELHKIGDNLAHILCFSPAVLYTAKPSSDSQITFVSENVSAQLGYKPEEFSGNSSFRAEHIHPEDAPRVSEVLSSLFQKTCDVIEYRFRHKEGRYHWIRDQMRVLRDEKGNPTEIIGSWTDITDRKVVEEALSYTQAKYKELVDLLPLCVFETDRNGILTFLNQGATEAIGYTRADLPKRPTLVQFLAAEDRERGSAAMNRILLHGKKIAGEEFLMQGKDGTTNKVALYARPIIREHQVVGAIGAGVDESEKKCSEGQLRASLNQKEVLVREMHHRVKNNLQVMSSLLRMQSQYVSDQTVAGALRNSEDRIRAMALVHERLYQSETLDQVEANDFIRSIVHHLVDACETATSEMRIRIDVQETNFRIEIAIPLGLIVNELVSNALNHAFLRKEKAR